MIASWQKNNYKPRQCIEKQRHCSANKGLYSQCYGLSNDQIQLWELDCKEGRAPKNWCLWTVVLEKSPESPLARRSNQSTLREVNPQYSLEGLIDAEAETPIFWSSDANNRLIWKVLNAGKDWGQKENRASEDEMSGWHHWCNGHELGKTSGNHEGQGGLACCSPWSPKELDMTGRLNNIFVTTSETIMTYYY